MALVRERYYNFFLGWVRSGDVGKPGRFWYPTGDQYLRKRTSLVLLPNLKLVKKSSFCNSFLFDIFSEMSWNENNRLRNGLDAPFNQR